MQTVGDGIKQAGETLVEGVAGLLGPNSPLHDINKPTSALVFIGPHYAFHDLPLEKKRLQSRLCHDHRHFIAIVRALLRTQPEDIQQKLEQCEEAIREVIEQTRCVWHSTTDEAMAAVRQAVQEILEAVSCLYDPAEGTVVLVPDTNALICNPAFQTWTFGGFSEFEILLVPPLLSELDRLKNEHRNPDVRQKAQTIIRQIKEYRRRGPLNDGVAVVSNRIRLRSIAIEPRVDEVLPWLDPASPDDRMLASCVEAMRSHPRSSVALVTGDINLQNKAEFGLIPFVEPPVKGTTDES